MHGGTDKDITERCKGCKGAGRHVRRCSVWKEVTWEPIGSARMSCQKCRAEGLGYEPAAPAKAAPAPVLPAVATSLVDPSRLAPAADGRRFNCSILDHGGRRLMAYRVGWSPTRIHVAELGADLQPVATTPIDLPHPRCAAGQEDPRLFLFGGILHLIFAGLEWKGGRLIVSQMVARLGSDLRAERVWEPKLADRRLPMEKNWMPFESGVDLHAVYTIRPHRVLLLDVAGGTAATAHETPDPPAGIWPGWELRGGAAPVRVGDEFYSFFHGWRRSKRAGTPTGDWYDYATGVYTFDAASPFAVRRVCRAPIWLADPARESLNVTRDKTVIYPCGALLDNGRWLVSAGQHDAECLIGTFPAADIERALEAV